METLNPGDDSKENNGEEEGDGRKKDDREGKETFKTVDTDSGVEGRLGSSNWRRLFVFVMKFEVTHELPG